MTFDEEYKIKLDEVEEIVDRYLPEEEGYQKTILSALNYSVRAGGKRLRPMLMLETYRLFDGRSKVIEPFMAAMEYIHTGSLVHDDLPCMDNDEFRRGKKTTWAVYGDDMGVLAGDALFFYAFETAGKAFDMNVNAGNAGKAMALLAAKSGIYGMTGGQTVDVEMSGKALRKDQLRFIYELKTGALIEASMMIGAILADASREDIRTVEHIAKRIGLAFQIQDDLLDVTSTTEELGKPVHSDEKNAKSTYVTLFGQEQAGIRAGLLLNEAIELLDSLTGENRFLKQLLEYLITRKK